MDQIQTIKLADGTELIPLEKEEKAKLEEEINAVLKKYNAAYLPVIKEEKSITNISQSAALFLLKKKEKSIPSPFIENGESINKTEEKPDSETEESGESNSREHGKS